MIAIPMMVFTLALQTGREQHKVQIFETRVTQLVMKHQKSALPAQHLFLGSVESCRRRPLCELTLSGERSVWR